MLRGGEREMAGSIPVGCPYSSGCGRPAQPLSGSTPSMRPSVTLNPRRSISRSLRVTIVQRQLLVTMPSATIQPRGDWRS